MRIGSWLYRAAGQRQQALVDRWRYAFGLLPRVSRSSSPRAQVALAKPYRASVIFSADLELAWGWRRARGSPEPLRSAIERGLQTRRNWPRLLAQFDERAVPVTWAIVGHLFLPGCTPHGASRHPEMRRPPYFSGRYWRYTEGDWFDGDPSTDVERDPAWYAPDLVRSLLESPNRHEVACHTFSHIDCSDAHCPPEVMDSELAACCRLASEWGLTLKTFVFPGNLPGNLASLRRHGFKACRWHGRYHLGFPAIDAHGIWRVPGGIHCERPRGWSTRAWVRALQRCVDRALETGTVLHFWLHPCCDPVNLDVVFPALLDYIAAHRSELWATTIGGLVDLLTPEGARDESAAAHTVVPQRGLIA